MKKTLLLAGVAALVSFNANAMEMKPYVGLDYVYSMTDIDKVDGEKLFEEDLNAFAITAGAKMHKNFGLEAFYQQSREESKDNNDFTKGKDEYNAFGLDAIGYLPIDHEGKFELLGSLGIGYYDVDYKLKDRLSGDRISEGDDGFGYRIGAGAQYNITENVAARVMARYVDLDVDGMDNMVDVTAGIRYSF